MKTLNTYINEWKLNDQSVKSVDDLSKYFIYSTESYDNIKVFYYKWSEFDLYKDKVYIDGKYAAIDNRGFTHLNIAAGQHKVKIVDINEIFYCDEMFRYCSQLVSVPKFDSSNVRSTAYMFHNCDHLIMVNKFDTKNVSDMRHMFDGCSNLNEETKRIWSNVYDFYKQDMKY